MAVRRQIEVSGIVQGVGFRPYVYRLATERHLVGTIRNTNSGVTIEVQGPDSAVQDFMAQLPREAPPLARITAIIASEIPCGGDREFRIVTSRSQAPVRTLISPEVATCSDCLREMFDPNDRRYRYPFINCTNCGPRFTIIHNIPYDRGHTSMAAFTMCVLCQAEYDDPLDRRFHAQPNACWQCGPRLQLWDNTGSSAGSEDPIANAISALRGGKIVAVKSLGGFHLAADATSVQAVGLLRERKRRIGKPFAIMVGNRAAAHHFCELSNAEATALESIQRPIVLLHRSRLHLSVIAEEVAPGNHYLGVFLPYTPIHHLLFREGEFEALVMTSGNLSEEPIAIRNEEALIRLSGLADYFLMHDRDILLRCDDSVVRILPDSPELPTSPCLSPKTLNNRLREIAGTTSNSAEKLQQLRRSRGFVPLPVFLRAEAPSVLAVGGELKNTICLTKGKHAFLSQHIGDLENFESYKFFEEAVEHLQKVLEIRPEVIAYDLHPNYFATQWALQRTCVPLTGVQHHHAHIASCMAENHLEGKVIGFALDGTGYGSDGKIWGGEVLIADFAGFERVAHFEYLPMPGGAAAIHEPWRMAISYLAHHFGKEFPKLKLPFLEKIPEKKLDLLLEALTRGINSPLTSSCGRLFDAVAATAGLRQQVTYEAQAAIELEMAIGNQEFDDAGAYAFELYSESESLLVGTRAMFETLIEDIGRERALGEISRRFHNGLVNVFTEIAERLRQRTSLNCVCLSGGTFNNLYLTSHLTRRLRSRGFEVSTQNEVPAGDGGLSLGQAMIAATLHSRL
jgi:hydrogenase maturation protein HypF